MKIVDRLNESELAVYYKNGSIQRFAGCEDIDRHRGIGPIDVVFDEFSEMPEGIWTTIIQPVLRENNGTATFVYTYKGQNHAWKMVRNMKDNPQWFISIKNVLETHSLTGFEISEAKNSMTEALFLQELMCEANDGAGQVFRRIKENLWHGKLEVRPGKIFQLGVDLAKYQDWTVITPFDYHAFKVGFQDRFNQIDWNLQEARIEAAHLRYNKARIKIDSTGVGDPIYENISKKGIPVEPFVFSESSKTQLLENLCILLEKDKIKIPDDIGLIDELNGFQWKFNEKNRKIKMTSSGTDDRVMSLALAVWDIPLNPLPDRDSREEKELVRQFDANRHDKYFTGSRYLR